MTTSTTTNAAPATIDAFRGTYEEKHGKCPAKKDDKPAFRAWRSAYNKACKTARKAGTLEPKRARDDAKVLTRNEARHVIAAIGGEWSPETLPKLRTAITASGFTFTPIAGHDDAFTITETPKAKEVELFGKPFPFKSAKALVAGHRALLDVVPTTRIKDPAIIAALAAHGFTVNDDGTITDPAKEGAPAPGAAPAQPAAQPANEPTKTAAKPAAKKDAPAAKESAKPAKRASIAANPNA